MSDKKYLAEQTSPDRIDYYLSADNRVGTRMEGDERRPFPLLHGNAIVAFLEICVEKGDVIGALGIMPGMACKHVRAVCEKRATITGNDVDGFKLEYWDRRAVKPDA